MNCPYCDSRAQLVDSSVIYNGHSYGWAWVCSRFPTCDAYVGCHSGTDKPLGRMANWELRDAKSRAHIAFDPLWHAKIRTAKCSKREARNRAYGWLAKQLGIPRKECHIGMFDVDLCRRTIETCAGWPKRSNPFVK